GARFYKGSSNTGTHVANLWSSSGTALATATFSNETSSGWQSVSFITPVQIQANTVYVISYHTNTGHYGQDTGYFNKTSDNSPLHAPSTSTSGGNGVYAYGSSSTFPNNTFNASNYWVDVVLSTSPSPSPTPQTCPCSLFGATATPANISSDSSALELGVKFR